MNDMHTYCPNAAIREEMEMKKEQARKITQVLKSLQIEYELDALKEFIKRNFPDMRAMLNKIQNYSFASKN